MLGFLNAAMAGATQRFMSIAQGENNILKQKKIFNVSFILHLIISIFVGIVLLIAGGFFFNGILNIPAERVIAAKVVYISLILSTIFTVMTTPYDAVMNAHENMKYYAIIGITESILKLIVAILVVYVSYDRLIIYGVLMAFIPILTLTIMRIYCHKNYIECTIGFRKYWDKNLIKNMSSYAGWSFVDASTGITANYGLGIVLNHFWGTILNAAQGIANQVGGQLMLFSQNMMKALNPVIMKSEGAGNRNFMVNTAILGCKYSFLLLSFFALPFMIEAPYVLNLWLKNVPDWSILFCRLQIIRSLFEQLTINLWAAIAAEGNIKNFYICKSILNILPLILSFVGFKFGLQPYWLYIFWIVCWGIINGLIIIYFAKKQCGLSIKKYINIVILPCIYISIPVLCIGSIPFLLMDESFSRFILSTIICIIIFSILFWIFLENKEKETIYDISKKIIKRWKY